MQPKGTRAEIRRLRRLHRLSRLTKKYTQPVTLQPYAIPGIVRIAGRSVNAVQTELDRPCGRKSWVCDRFGEKIRLANSPGGTTVNSPGRKGNRSDDGTSSPGGAEDT